MRGNCVEGEAETVLFEFDPIRQTRRFIDPQPDNVAVKRRHPVKVFGYVPRSGGTLLSEARRGASS